MDLGFRWVKNMCATESQRVKIYFYFEDMWESVLREKLAGREEKFSDAHLIVAEFAESKAREIPYQLFFFLSFFFWFSFTIFHLFFICFNFI